MCTEKHCKDMPILIQSLGDKKKGREETAEGYFELRRKSEGITDT